MILIDIDSHLVMGFVLFFVFLCCFVQKFKLFLNIIRLESLREKLRH